MTNLEETNRKLIELQTALCKALKADDAEGVAKAFNELGDYHAKKIRAEFEDHLAYNDSQILEKAGIEQFTSAEIKAFERVIETQKDKTVAVSVPASAFPDTFITRTLNEAIAESPLLQAVNITNVGFITQMILDESASDPASWSKMGATITETTLTLNTISTQAFKLAKIIVVPREMLDMGPKWLAKYIKDRLKECFRLGLETGIVAGDGANAPLGMNRTRKNGTNAQGQYSKKEAVEVTSFKPTVYGALLASLAVNSFGKARSFDKVILIAHPTTIFKKIMPATCVRKPDGTYSEMIFPFPTIVIPSVAMDEDEGILGLNKKYEVFISTGTSKEGNIEQDNSIHFAEHMAAFKIFLYGNGAFVDENDFMLLDFANLVPDDFKVVIANTEENPVPVSNVSVDEGEEDGNEG